jgi:hypothetical protein
LSVFVWLCSSIVHASLIVEVESKSVAAGQSGFLDVFLAASGSNPQLQGYDVRVRLSPTAAGVTLGTPQKTDVGANPRPAVFPDALSPVSSDGATIYAASDTATAVSIADQVGLARIPFTTTLAASGPYALLIDTSPIGTLLANGNGDAIPFTTMNGSLSVTPVPPIVLGDFNLDGQLTGADVPAILAALKDLNAYKTAHGLSDAQLRSLGDVNGDFNPAKLTGGVNNADLQSLLNLLAGRGTSVTSVPEPQSLFAAIWGVALICAWSVGISTKFARKVRNS